jgi:hypothetical protein
VRDRDEVDGVVEHDEPRGAEPGARVAHRLVRERRRQPVVRQHRVRDARHHRGDRASGTDTAAERVDHLVQRRAERELADAVPARRAGDRAHDRSG